MTFKPIYVHRKSRLPLNIVCVELSRFLSKRLSGEARKRYFVTCTLFSLFWYEIKDVPIYR